MTDPLGNRDPSPKFQRDLESGELEELNRLRAWREHQEREEHARRLEEHHRQLAHDEQQRRLADQQRRLYEQQQPNFAQHPAAYPYPPPQPYAPVQQVTVNNVKHADCPHLLHLVLTAITCGAWLPVWIIHAIIVAARN